MQLNEKKELPVLINEEDLQKRVKELAEEISEYYKNILNDDEPLYVIGILKGAFIFTADLIRHIQLPLHIDFMKLSSYNNKNKSSGKVSVLQKISENLEGKHVLIVEDIIDTGQTLNCFIEEVQKLKIGTVETVSLLVKKDKYKSEHDIRFQGFQIEDEYIVGYGLDYAGFMRNLPYLSFLKK